MYLGLQGSGFNCRIKGSIAGSKASLEFIDYSYTHCWDGQENPSPFLSKKNIIHWEKKSADSGPIASVVFLFPKKQGGGCRPSARGRGQLVIIRTFKQSRVITVHLEGGIAGDVRRAASPDPRLGVKELA